MYQHTAQPQTTNQTNPITQPTTTPAVSTKPPPAKLVFFRCPKCPHQLNGTKPAFHHHNLDTRIWCNQCQRQRFVKLWQCSCNLPWHTCPIHRDEPTRLCSLAPPTTEGRQQAPQAARPHNHRRALGQGRDDHTHRWLDQPPPKRHKPEPMEVELEVLPHLAATGPKPNLMGPKLLARFPQAGSGQAS